MGRIDNLGGQAVRLQRIVDFSLTIYFYGKVRVLVRYYIRLADVPAAALPPYLAP